MDFDSAKLNARPFGCDKAADVNGSDNVDIADPVYLLNFLFRGFAAPPAPFPGCGTDPTTPAVTCDVYTNC